MAALASNLASGVTNGLVAYLRVSTHKQGASGLGIEAQRAAVAAFADQHGARILREFVEVESGKSAERPQLHAALAYARRAQATLTIAKLDRLSRNVAFLANLMDAGVEFCACDNPHANRLTVHILAAVAEEEARAASQRTKAALAAAKAKGTLLGAHRPQARALSPASRAAGQARGAQANRAKAAAVYADLLPRVRALRSAGASCGALARALNAEGHVTARGAQWSATHVHRLLKRAAHALQAAA
jgi:DNA invertase Pin-like site-specific DNA recombinase